MMRNLIAPTLAAATLMLGGCMGNGREAESAATDAGLAKALAGRTAGPATSCLPTQLSPASTKVYGKTLLYTFTNGDVYANDTAGGCEGSGDDLLIQIEYQGRACSGDMIRTVDRNSRIPTGACALGQFTPYPKPRR